MAYRLGAFSGVGLDEALLTLVIDEHVRGVLPRMERLWTYYRNPLRPVGVGALGSGGAARGGRWYRLAQEMGLPARIIGGAGGTVGLDDRFTGRREVVVENDIAWRVHAMVDFMFGRPARIVSTARDPGLREKVQRALDAVWENSGGIALMQDAATLAHVYGHVDLALRVDEAHLPSSAGAGDDADGVENLLRGDAAGFLRIEAIEPRRGIAILDPADYRTIIAYVIHHEQALNALEDGTGGIGRADGAPIGGRRAMLERLLARASSLGASWGARRRRVAMTEIISGGVTQTYQDGELVDEREHSHLDGKLPVVHIQNLSQPFSYEGIGEVEGLIPLQDELNTRLSDRASRVTLQSFKMYLAKGIEGFDKVAVGPGQIWSTDNPDAEVKEFGGDASSPSEERHILEVREALDKVSGVPPLASGVVRAKLGNLTSATALKVTLMGLVSKTERKRVTYGRGMQAMCRLILAALDSAGIVATDEADRGVRIDWPNPLPIDERDLVANVKAKVELGASREDALRELGEAAVDPGVQ